MAYMGSLSNFTTLLKQSRRNVNTIVRLVQSDDEVPLLFLVICIIIVAIHTPNSKSNFNNIKYVKFVVIITFFNISNEQFKYYESNANNIYIPWKCL